MSSGPMSARVVLGYDGRWQAPGILDVAAAEALDRGLPLSIVTLIHAPEEVAAFHGRPADGWRPRVRVRQCLDDAVLYLRQRRPGLRVSTYCLTFAEARPTVEPFASAELLVIGVRGDHDVPAFSPGSPSRRLTLAAGCSIMVVPEAGPAHLVVPVRT